MTVNDTVPPFFLQHHPVMPQNSSMFIPSSDILQVLHRVYIPIDSPQFWPKIPDAGHTSSHDCRCLGWTWFPPLMQPSASHVGQPPGRWGSIQESQVVYPRSIWRSLVWGMGSSWILKCLNLPQVGRHGRSEKCRSTKGLGYAMMGFKKRVQGGNMGKPRKLCVFWHFLHLVRPPSLNDAPVIHCQFQLLLFHVEMTIND